MIKIIKDQNMPSDLTGGEYATVDITIHVDPRLPVRTQRMLVIHSIIENYCMSWSHNKVEELCSFIEDGLDDLSVNPPKRIEGLGDSVPRKRD